jgi:hypothetical protein
MANLLHHRGFAAMMQQLFIRQGWRPMRISTKALARCLEASRHGDKLYYSEPVS